MPPCTDFRLKKLKLKNEKPPKKDALLQKRKRKFKDYVSFKKGLMIDKLRLMHSELKEHMNKMKETSEQKKEL
jgi:hypothetical protein